MITDSQCICNHCERGIHRLSKRSWHRQHTGYRVRALCSSDLVRWFLDRRQNGPCRFGARLRPAECAGRGTESWQRGLRGTRAREAHLRIGTICSIVVQFHSSSFSAMCRCSQKAGSLGLVTRNLRAARSFNHPDSKGAYESNLASCLEVRVVR